MSSYKNIFVEGDLTLEELVEILKGMLDITHEYYHPERGMPYNLYEEHTDIRIGENTFFNYDDLNFEDYHYEIDLRGIHFKDGGERSHWEYQRALYIFNRLKETGKYRLMLTFDEQIKDEEFIPPQYQQPPSDYAIKAQQLPEDITIHTRGNVPISDFVHELEQLLHTSAKEIVVDSDYSWYHLYDGRAQYHVSPKATPGHYDIDVKGRVYIPGERRYWQFESARNLYEQLKSTGKYTLQLKGNRGHIFEEYPLPQQE